jgi:Fe-S-cluster containining protein
MDGAAPDAGSVAKADIVAGPMENYVDFLARVDAWYRGVQQAHPDKVPCTRGCRDCCLGLFDISIADRELLRKGLAEAPADVRLDIQARASKTMAALRDRRPDLKETLDGWSSRDIDDLCDELGDVECPVLGKEGECRLYAHRPLICRLSGVPVVDQSGVVIYPEGCVKCTLKPSETPRIEYAGLRKRERKLLKAIDPDRSGATLLIPQALEPERGERRL